MNPAAPVLDLFGAPIDVRREPVVVTDGKRKPPVPKGYAAPPGTGPDGETCRSCLHYSGVELARVYRKCGLMRAHWTGGPGTDIRAASPACARWEAKISGGNHG